jgi:hypothetical protein
VTAGGTTVEAVDRDEADDAPTAADRSAQAALGVFVVAVAVTFVAVLFHLGRHRWFFSDDWNLLADREPGSFQDLFRPNNAHWSTLGTIAYDVVWRVFGLRSYLPYQAMSVASHLFVVVMVRVVMRRAGVSPWLATAACAGLLVLAAGVDNIVWAFQITNTGSVAFGLVQLTLADHDGRIGRRDALAVGAGLLALMCNGIAVTMVGVVGLAVLVRRGWRPALVQVVPLAIAQGVWTLIEDPQSGSPVGRPSVGTVVRWLVRFVEATFEGIGGGSALLGWVFAAVLVGGTALAVAGRPLAETRARLAAPAALALGALAFSATTALGRWHLGTESAGASRYVYTGAALVLPLLAVGAQALADRWRPALPILLVLFLVPVPMNVRDFRDGLYNNEDYFGLHRRVLTAAAYVPFADEVPDDVRPLPNPFIPDALDMGYLREARREGKLDPPRLPLHPGVVEQMRVRLGLAQRKAIAGPAACTPIEGPLVVDLEEGASFPLRTPIEVVGIGADGTRSQPVPYQPANGAMLTVELPDLRVEVRPPFGARAAQWCGPT